MKTTSTTLCILVPLSLGVSHAATVTSIASGEWDVATTWSDNTAAPTTGTQGTGNDYIVAATHTVTSNDTGNNTQALIGSSLTVQSGGILDLARIHSLQAQSLTFNLPSLTLNDGSELQFRSSLGTNTFNLSNTIQSTGNVLFDNTGGGYDANIVLNGALSGSGQITYTTANSGSSSAVVRTLALKSANSPFTGNWIVRHATTGDDFGALRADAANALGTGTVTLENRARLINNTANGLDSLTGISLTGANTLADLGTGWTSPGGSLTLASGSVSQGSVNTATGSSFQSLTQSGGTINFDLGQTEGAGDRIELSGAYHYTGGTLQVTPRSVPGANSYTLVSYDTLTGTPNVAIAPNYRLAAVADPGTGSQSAVSVSFTGNIASLTWKGTNGTSPSAWNINSTPNFDDGVNQTFYQLDEVLFDDTATTYTVEMTGALIPSQVTFNAASDYTLTNSGTGYLTGAAALTKLGSGTLTLGGSNGQDFTGPVVVQDGTLKLASRDAFGRSSGVTVGTNARIDLNGQTPGTVSTGGYSYSIAGSGPDGDGAIIHSGTTSIASNAGVKNLTLLSNATIGAVGSTATRFDVGGANIAGTGVTDTAGFTLTQKGPGSIYYRGTSTNFKLDVVSGRAGAEGTSPAVFGGANGQVTVRENAQAYLVGTGTYENTFNLSGLGWAEGSGSLGALRLSNNTSVSGPIHLTGTTRITAYNASGTLSGTISGDESAVLQLGGPGLAARSGDITVSGDNTYAGGTEIRGGVMTATSSTAFGTGPILIDEGNAVGYITRLNLQSVTIANDIVSDSNAQTGFLGTVVATGGARSTVNGSITVTSGVGNGGHFASSGAGSVLRLNGPILSTLTTNVRSGTVEVAGGGTYPELWLGQDTLRLVADNGVNPAARLNLAVSLPGTFDLNGYQQTIDRVTRHTTHTATITNTSANPSTLTIDGSTDFTYNGTINNGTGGISLTKAGSSTMTLSGVASIAGAVTVQEGTLLVNAALGTAGLSPVTVDGGTLGGTGPFLGTVTVYGTLAPATTTGTLVVNDALSFGPGSSLVSDLANATGTAGTDWDLVTAKSATFAGNPGQPVRVVIPAIPGGFSNSALSYEIVRTTDGITGFDPSSVVVDASAISTSGTWSLSVAGNSLYLDYTPGTGTPFQSWADANGISGATPEQDNDLDGIRNAIEFVIGGDPSGPNSNSLHLLPTVARSNDALTFTFRRTSAAAGEDIVVEYSTNLTTWIEAEAGEDGVTVNEIAEGFGDGVDRVDVVLPLSLADSQGKLFARLKVTID